MRCLQPACLVAVSPWLSAFGAPTAWGSASGAAAACSRPARVGLCGSHAFRVCRWPCGVGVGGPRSSLRCSGAALGWRAMQGVQGLCARHQASLTKTAQLG